MNQGRIWCVVSPNHGLPLFLGSVALMSFTVHYAVLSNTSWYKEFYNGVPMTKTSMVETVAPLANVASVQKPALAIGGEQSTAMTSADSKTFVVKIKPKLPLDPATAVPG
jgi:light-harvesting protein B-800-850 alpha chain